MSDIDNLIGKINALAARRAQAEKAPRIDISPKVLAQLKAVVRRMPKVDESSPALSFAVQKYLMTSWRKSHPELAEFLGTLKKAADEHGFYVLNIKSADSWMFNKDKNTRNALLVLLSANGAPFGCLESGPHAGLWRTHGVDPDKKQGRAESTGQIPFHMDFHNTENPPDGSALYCDRPDPGGGGANLLVNYRRILAEFTDAEKETLSRVSYKYSDFFGLHGVGKLVNPTQLMQKIADRWLFRYNGKARPDMEEGSDEARLFDALEKLLCARSEKVLLRHGDLLFADQRQAFHARESLKFIGRYRADPKTDRRLWETYTRAPALAAA